MNPHTGLARRFDRSLTARTRAAVVLVAGLGGLGIAIAATKTYTTTADFNLGTVIGVSTAGDKLELSATGSTFPVLWVANAGEDTITKFDTTANKELARYRTWFGPAGQPGHAPHLNNAFAGAAPSRTAVDIDGNAYILNRHFDGRPPVLMKILANGFVDRNGNGVADTSADANADGLIGAGELKDLGDTNGNSIIDVAELQDERVAWAVRVPDGTAGFPLRPGAIGRALCIAPSGNLWVGLYNDGSYYEVRASDGKTLRGPINVGINPYGCLVDGAGKLWSAGLSPYMGRLDTIAGTSSPPVYHFNTNYGIAIDNNYVYMASYGGSTSYQRINKATSAVDYPASVGVQSLGISVDGDGNIVTGPYGGGVIKFNAATGAMICQGPSQNGFTDTRGVIADADGNIWQISVSGSTVSKYSKTCAPLGVFPVGNYPYTYSDAAGLAARTITTRTGDWNVVYDGATAGKAWGKVSWNATVPPVGSLIVSVRTADTIGALPAQPFTDVGNGVEFSKTGRFIEVRTRLATTADGASPVVFDVTVASKPLVCDANGDDKVDKNDIAMINAARNTSAAPGDVRDANGDGVINTVDARLCTQKCTKPNCAP